MARACGIHLGRRRFEVVVLDGGPRKHRVVFRASGEVEPDDDWTVAMASALKEATKGQKVPPHEVGLAIDSGLAAFRTMRLPFDDRGKIEEVLKFEVESKLPQWEIEDVVVDFLVLSSTPGVESQLLVTAVPKDALGERIRACERAGLEPVDAELDATALFDAARQAGALDPEGAQVLVHVGDASTAVVVADGGRLASLRSIHIGAAASEPDGADEEGEAGVEDDPAERERLLAVAARRIRRELGRTISAAPAARPVQSVLVTGIALPGLADEPVLDVPVRRLSVLPGEEEEGAGDGAAYAVAYGAALRRLGAGALAPHLRREELRFSGKFERLELPLAVASLLLLTVLLVQWIVLQQQIGWRGEGDLGDPYVREDNRSGDTQLWLESSNNWLLPDPDEDRPGRLNDPPPEVAEYARLAERGGDRERTKYQQLHEIRRRLRRAIEEKKTELGQISEVVQPPSALEALSLVFDLVDRHEEEFGRFAFRSVRATYIQSRLGGDRPDAIEVKLDMDFLAEDDVAASRNFNALGNEFGGQPWVLDYKQVGTKVLEGGRGIYAEGMTILIDPAVAVEAAE